MAGDGEKWLLTCTVAVSVAPLKNVERRWSKAFLIPNYYQIKAIYLSVPRYEGMRLIVVLRCQIEGSLITRDDDNLAEDCRMNGR